jgi:SET domain-containing protein
MNVEVKKSRIEGLGIFALVLFAKGQCIRKINVIREITNDAPIREDLGERIDHCDYPDGKVVLLGYPDRHINHSCDPNAYVQYDEDGCYFYAKRDISAGEEITCDYNINITGGTSWPCNCGAIRCRGETIGDFFKLPIDIQQEYRPFLASWFIQRYRETLKSLDEGSDKNT